MLESGILAGMMISSARAASTSSQDWKRAASVNSTGTPSSSIRREVGSSSRGGQPRHVKFVHAGGKIRDQRTQRRHNCQLIILAREMRAGLAWQRRATIK
jgi:hypothetical protein